MIGVMTVSSSPNTVSTMTAAATIIISITIMTCILIPEDSTAFSSLTNIAHRQGTRWSLLPSCQHTRRRRRMRTRQSGSDLLLGISSSGYGDDNFDFYRDLERAKIEKLGANIPPEEARKSAVQAEQDFLAAMKEVSKEFQKAKEELGSDGAVDLFLNRMKKEDEVNRKEQKNDDVDDDMLLGVFQ